MEYSASPEKIQNASGRWFMVVSQIDGGYLVRDEVTSVPGIYETLRYSRQ